MLSHSSIGASSAYRWMACPGSVALIATCPEQEQSKYAAEGTAAHELAAKALLGNKLASRYPGYEEEAYDAVQTYLAIVREDLKSLKGILHVEQKFDLYSLYKGLYGTNDATVHVPFGKLIVYDFKFGAGVQVDAEENPQLLYYALGALMTLGDFDPVEFVIVQPRGGGSPVKRWETSQKHVYEFGEKLVLAAQATEKKNAKLCAGDHCKFCPALSKCPKVQEEVMKTTALDFAKPAPQTLPDPTALTMPQVKRILDLLPLVDDWARAVEEHAEHLAKSGQNIPGYKLVKKRSNRAWISEPEVLKTFEPLYGAKIFAPRKILSPAQMEKLTGKGNAIIVDTLCMNPDNGEILVKNEDPRPGVGCSVALDFKDK
jgi:hypothetical protein